MENLVVTSYYELKSLNPQIAVTYKEEGFDEVKGYVILDFGEKTKDDITECNLQVSFKDNVNIIKAGASCGCTRPTFKKVDDYYIVHVYFNNKEVKKDVSKYFSLQLDNGKTIKFNLIINK